MAAVGQEAVSGPSMPLLVFVEDSADPAFSAYLDLPTESGAQYLLFYDELTGLPNHRHLARILKEEYVGADVSYAARVESLGCGGQVLLSSRAWRACHEESGTAFARWPDRHLRGFEGMATVYELLCSGVSLGEPGAAGRPVHERARSFYEAGRWASGWVA